ncbi:MAG: DUF4382 domain-containing protein [Gemmatimonadota bacterium]
MTIKARGLVLPLLAGVFALGGCDDGGATAAQPAETRVLLARGGTAAAGAAALSAGLAAAPVSLQDDVSAIEVRVTAVQALRAGGDAEGEGGWATLRLAAPAMLDLLKLPTDAASGGVEIAREGLAQGTYGHVRLLVDSATITFKREVKVGQAVYAAGRETPLTIPSGKIRTPVEFTVGAQSGATIKLVFDADASVKKVTATGASRVMMPPVISARRVQD